MRNVPDTLTNERTAVFIDYHNTQNALRRAGRQIDLVGLRQNRATERWRLQRQVWPWRPSAGRTGRGGCRRR